jgi:acid phosphatase family membrane protein YuiD
MNIWEALLSNTILMAAFTAWFSAQGFKIVHTIIKTKKFDVERIMGSGGMPSSHSATVCATTASIGISLGVDTPLFALAVIFSFIVMYDATGVRRAAGKQAKVLNSIIHELSLHQRIDYPTKLKELLGHSYLEVFVGAVLGTIIGFLFMT